MPRRWNRATYRLSRTLEGVGRASPGSAVAAPLHQAALSTRARSNMNPARPYICRVLAFNRFTCPSTGPLVKVSYGMPRKLRA